MKHYPASRWLLPILLQLAACSDQVDKVLGQAVGAAEAAQGEEMQLSRKLDPYIECMAEHSTAAFDVRRRYLSWLSDPEQGPRCEQRHRVSVDQLGSIESCLQELAGSRKRMPSLSPLEQAGERYAVALEQLARSLQRAHEAYAKASPAGVDCGQAQTLHRELIKGWEIFGQADTELRELVERYNARLLQHELLRTLERHGKGLRFFHQRTRIEAARALRVIRKQERTGSADLEALSTVVAEFEATVAGLRQVAQRMPEATENAFFWDSFAAQTTEFLNVLKEFASRSKRGHTLGSAHAKRAGSAVAGLVSGSYAKVEHEYEELLRLSNSLEFHH